MTRFKKQPIPKELRLAVFERDGYVCRYCGVTGVSFHADHVFPESKGGVTTIENLVTACPKCNHAKHAIVGIWPKPIGHFSVAVKKDRKPRVARIKKTDPKVIVSGRVVLFISLVIMINTIIYFAFDLSSGFKFYLSAFNLIAGMIVMLWRYTVNPYLK